jgi:hypothetical protein
MTSEPPDHFELWDDFTLDDLDANDHPPSATLAPFAADVRSWDDVDSFRDFLAASYGRDISRPYRQTPGFLILHHTVVPSTTAAPYPTGARWPASEAQQHALISSLGKYYAGLGWESGPHLFVGPDRIWQLTPLDTVGTHANGGNCINGVYSIGVEVVGYFDHRVWEPRQAALVGGLVRACAEMFGFSLDYRRGPGGFSFHRDYNPSKSCPGLAITPAYALGMIQHGAVPQPLHAGERYVVRSTVTAGATVRNGPRRAARAVETLRAGAPWIGAAVAGELVTLAGFGQSDVWIVDDRGRCVWSGLLREAS